ncbi:hypothetical protein HAX54_038818 [Datura stramonium]|uniref:Uncharacterized protein n=1 Tax=Datura stramonium TaxID=4076 RepID=A0ABS8SJE4_DATST|nr:hypothetical protein [Datura stramonium]
MTTPEVPYYPTFYVAVTSMKAQSVGYVTPPPAIFGFAQFSGFQYQGLGNASSFTPFGMPNFPRHNSPFAPPLSFTDISSSHVHPAYSQPTNTEPALIPLQKSTRPRKPTNCQSSQSSDEPPGFHYEILQSSDED